MGWEMRGNGRYYYEKVRNGGKVTSRYLPRLVAPLVDGLARMKEAQRRELAALRDEQNAVDKHLDAVCGLLRAAIADLLTAGGFRQHKGQWRKRRMLAVRDGAELERADKEKAAALKFGFLTLAVKIYEQGDAAKPEIVKGLREGLAQYSDLWRIFGDLPNAEQERLIRAAWRGDLPGAESVTVAVAELKKTLGYDEASPLAKLAIDEIALAWLRLYSVQGRHTDATHDGDGSGIRPPVAEFWDRRLEYAQRRYLRAVESLARIRKLERRLPAVIVNLAERQMNVIN